jgi:hypothetical protein
VVNREREINRELQPLSFSLSPSLLFFSLWRQTENEKHAAGQGVEVVLATLDQLAGDGDECACSKLAIP